MRPTVSTVARVQLLPVPIIPRQSPSAPALPLLGSTAPRGPVLAPSAQSKTSEGNGEASVPGNLGTYCGVSARFPQVLTTPGLPTKGVLQSTSFPPIPLPTEEPRGDT